MPAKLLLICLHYMIQFLLTNEYFAIVICPECAHLPTENECLIYRSIIHIRIIMIIMILYHADTDIIK
jgi:hypothetical protein